MNSRVFVALAAFASFPSSASAHAFLKRAQPSAGAALASAPNRVVLAFNEKLDPTFSGVTVTDAAGRNVAASAAAIHGVSMIVPLRPLKQGAYKVAWHAVSLDSHRTEGAYSFTVKQ
jgi:methionine-rich copper-binding protein CopC